MLLSTAFVTFNIRDMASASIITVDDSGGADHLTIQDAIDNATDGDTVFVFSGAYYENLIIDKSINLTGENRDSTFIDGGESGDAVYITVDGVSVSGFNITANRSGLNRALYTHSTNNGHIFDCIFQTSNYGVTILYSPNYNISHCKIWNNSWGIYISSSDNFYIDNCEVVSNGIGLFLYSSNDVFVRHSDIVESIKPIELRADSHITNINTTFSEPDVDITDELSSLKIGWTIDVYANDTVALPVENANVFIYNATGAPESQGLTGPSGYAIDLECIEKEIWKSSTKFFTPHTIIGYKAGVGGNQTTQAIPNNTLINLTLISGNNSRINDIAFSQSNIVNNEIYFINASISNTGEYPLDIEVSFYQNGSYIGNNILNLSSGENGLASLQRSSPPGFHEITVRIDPSDAILEYNEYDNEMTKQLKVDWLVTTSETVQDQNRVISNLTVANGGILTLNNVWLQVWNKYDGQHNIEVQDGGTLRLTISNITSYDQNMGYMFWIRDGAALEIVGGDIKNCGYDDGNLGLTIETDDATIAGCHFTENYYGIFISGANNTQIAVCSFENNDRDGTWADGCNNVTISGCTFINNQRAVLFDGTHNSVIEDSIVSDHSYYGIQLGSSDDNIIRNIEMNANPWGGIIMGYSSDNKLENLWINDSIMSGINIFGYAQYAITEIFNSSIYNCGQGMDIYFSSDIIAYNCTIQDNVIGIELERTQLTLFNSSIQNNTQDDIHLIDDFSVGNSEISLVNTSYNETNIDISPLCRLYVKWFLQVDVEDSLGLAVSGAQVTVKDKNGIVCYDGQTGIGGRIEYIILTEYLQETSTTTSFLPYIINGSKFGYVSDGDSIDLNENKDVTLTLADNTPPVADFVIDSYEGNITTLFEFDATSSYDNENSTADLFVRWDFENDGFWDTEWNTAKIITHDYTAPGTYTIKLEVNDTCGAFANASHQLTVINESPKPSFSVTPSFGDITEIFNFNADECNDLEDISADLQIRWNFENDGNWDTNWTTTKTITHQYTSPGNYTIKMEVKDTFGSLNYSTRQITVINERPTASFTISPSTGNISETFTFDANGCSDLEDPINDLEVRWDFENDGAWDTEWTTTKIVLHQYASPNTYRVGMEVRDTGGLLGHSTKSIAVYIDSGNVSDDDNDDDGFLDDWEEFLGTDSSDPNDVPLDTDGDGIPDGDKNNTMTWMDADDDDDGVPDSQDYEPLDPDVSEPPETEQPAEQGIMKYWWLIVIGVVVLLVAVALVFIIKRKGPPIQEAFPPLE